jgi:PAS domain S-box-containing protein
MENSTLIEIAVISDHSSLHSALEAAIDKLEVQVSRLQSKVSLRSMSGFEKYAMILVDLRETGAGELIKRMVSKMRSPVPAIIGWYFDTEHQMEARRAYEAGALDVLTEPNEMVILNRLKKQLVYHLEFRKLSDNLNIKSVRIAHLEEQLERCTMKLHEEADNNLNARIELKNRTFDLNERIKELKSLLEISTLSEKETSGVQEFLKRSLSIIASAFQYPEITCVRVQYKNNNHQTDNFKETQWRLGKGLMDNDSMIGYLTVCYLEERPEKDFGPFMKEEKNLMVVMSKYLSQIIVRKETEGDLKVFEEIVKQSQAIIMVLDSEGRLEYANPKFAEVLGYDTEKVKGKIIYLADPDSEDWQLYENLMEVARSGKQWRGEINVRTSDGSSVLTHAVISPLYNNLKIDHYVGILSDITSQKEFEELIHKNLETYTKLADNIEAGISIVDPKGKFLYVNDQLKKMFNVEGLDLVGRAFVELRPEKDALKTLLSLQQTIHSRLPRTFEVTYSFSGTPQDYQINRQPLFNKKGDIYAVLSIIQEVTERRLMLKALEQSRKNFHEIIDNNPEGMFVVDSKGMILFSNKKIVEITGFKPEETNQMSIIDVLKPKEVKKTESLIRCLLQSKKVAHHIDSLITSKKGVTRNAEMTATLTDWEDKPAVLFIIKDVTRQKKMEKLISIQNAIDSLSSMKFELKEDIKNIFDILMGIEWVDAGGVYLYNEKTDAIEVLYNRGHSKQIERKLKVFGNDTVAIRILKDKKSLYLGSIQIRQYFDPYLEYAKDRIKFIAVIPLVFDELLVGSFYLVSNRFGNIDPLDKQFMQSLGARLARIITMIREQEKIKGENRELTARIQSLEGTQ